jgi:type III restriction enzyme
MDLPKQITQYMSLREPQAEALEVLHEISGPLDYKTASIASVAATASEKSRSTKPIEFDTAFPSFCFALATGVGKTRLMGGCMYYLWKSKGYRHFFILAPNITIYDKLRAELSPAHPKYMFVGLSDFPRPDVYDGDNYLRFRPAAGLLEEGQARVFIFNISKIFSPRTDTEFRFHRFNEYLGNSFSAILREMDDLVVLMDESHRYRGKASLEAINHLKPALGLEFTATPLKAQKDVIYAFSLAQSMGRFIKTPTVVTRTNLTTSDEEEIERLKLQDGMTLHEKKKGRLLEYCETKGLPLVKPFVLVSTKDTTHAAQVRALIESETFCEGRYRGKVIEIHSGTSGAESDANVERLLAVEQPTSTVEVVVHVNMLKEGWDVKNLYTIIPLRASTSEILTEQTIGRGLRLPFGVVTGDEDLDALEIVSHDQYERLIAEARNNPLFKVKQYSEDELRPVKTVTVTHKFLDMERVLDRLRTDQHILFTSELTNERRLNEVVTTLVAEETAKREQQTQAAAAATGESPVPAVAEPVLFGVAPEKVEEKPFDAEAYAAELRERLRTYAYLFIDVPRITTDTSSERKLAAFEVKVNVGPFELVDQRLLAHDLASGKERLGDKVEVMEVENPRAFLAGRLIDAVEEFDVANDKDPALALVDSYLKQMNAPSDKLGRLVHLYRDPIIGDLCSQVESHIQDETKVEIRVGSGMIRFGGYAKTVLAVDGVVPYTRDVPRADIRRYLFEGYTKSLYDQVPYDSTPEKDFAALLERDAAVLKWIRPAERDLSIGYRGRGYTPDFIVETADRKYLIEVKARDELQPLVATEVRDKALAAIRWCQAASGIPAAKQWEYKLVPDDVVGPAVDLRFVLSQAVRPA